MEKNDRCPRWIEKIEDEKLRAGVAEIFKAAGLVRFREGRFKITQSEGDEADLIGAREDLREKLLKIYNSGSDEKNPLYAAVMLIRPQVIARRLDTQYTSTIADALWTIKKSADSDEKKAAFFGRLASRLNGYQISFCRGVISGDQVGERKINKAPVIHYFPGIPLSLRREAEVKLTTHPDNMEKVKKAYGLMAQKAGEGPAKEAMEAHLRDIEQLSKLVYPPRKEAK